MKTVLSLVIVLSVFVCEISGMTTTPEHPAIKAARAHRDRLIKEHEDRVHDMQNPDWFALIAQQYFLEREKEVYKIVVLKINSVSRMNSAVGIFHAGALSKKAVHASIPLNIN
ncbi:hypothetical protein EB796_000300 [Bugula neritina]|uniref:Uncharacterized protein n=1 Tax=Bugula neritina TaxID=10212 RepID=A0A7J7KTH5_BUGNE|nr:hypothetical protein EB796_000300 [Bugula neritina]